MNRPLPTTSAASLTAFAGVGCVWQGRAISSELTLNSIANATYAISVPSSGPMTWAPMTL